ncbi:membrane cofactor protein-like isoform X3 [Pteronotus mesoamericanus]|uniref:membrane cofactor protein-like isoform X3 n=1 Tax=Pteronotus mesoamericanus TaxID=1884717 RepID=UPI0023EDF4D4|nr:membrane cofactor protein-like isoform X3 [Pteronotus parnellii mesoamericanus]
MCGVWYPLISRTMTASCGSRPAFLRRPESPLSSWSFVVTMGLVFLLTTPTVDSCGAPPRFNTMALKGSSQDTYQPGEQVEYQCRPGYMRRFPPLPLSSVCQPDGTWKPLQEACKKKQCQQLGEPINGQVVGGFEFGSRANYSCNDGYYLVGPPTLYCELSGDNNVNWDNEPPRCEAIYCQPPRQIQNGVTNNHKDAYVYGEVVTYRCSASNGPDEYSLVGESKLVCSGPNKWSSDPPECKVVKCPYPVPENGMLLSGMSRKYYYQAAVEIGCKEGFYLQGQSRVVCGANSMWEPELPQCIRVPALTSPIPPTSSASGPVPPSTAPVPGQPEPSSVPPPQDLGGGPIAGIVIAILAVVAVIVTVAWYCLKKKKGKTEVNAEYKTCRDKLRTPVEETH